VPAKAGSDRPEVPCSGSDAWPTTHPQPPAIASVVYDAIGVWVTELPITPERVLRALAAKEKGPRMEGKWAIFDEEISVNTVAHAESRFRFPVG